jgi:hypothetical protein
MKKSFTKSITIASIIAASISLSGCYETKSGQKIGVITKLAQEGLFVKTWEAEMIRGGIQNGSGVNGGSFHFTIENPELLEKVKQAMDTQTEVEISYSKEAITFIRSESDYFLKDIKSQKPSPVSTSQLQIITKDSSVSSSKQEKIEQLLKVQAQLIQEIATK